MGNRYIVARQAITPTASNDVFQFLSLASRRTRILQVAIGGLGSSSAAQQLIFGRSTGGTTAGGADHVPAVSGCDARGDGQGRVSNFIGEASWHRN
jgi:hypothetical protein